MKSPIFHFSNSKIWRISALKVHLKINQKLIIITLSTNGKSSLNLKKKSGQIILYLEIFNFKTFWPLRFASKCRIFGVFESSPTYLQILVPIRFCLLKFRKANNLNLMILWHVKGAVHCKLKYQWCTDNLLFVVWKKRHAIYHVVYNTRVCFHYSLSFLTTL